MDQVHSTTEQHVKGKHLTYDERMIIQIRHKEGCSPKHIAAEIGCAPNMVRNELRRGTIDLYNGHVQRYKAKQGQQAYEQNCMEYSEHFSEVFKTIPTDNGSEFSRLSELEELADTLVYFAHPYTSCEKGTNERHNGIIRRFIPKGKRIDSYTAEEISNIEVWCNSLPRRILGYRTPDEVFEAELDRIYRAA